MTPNSLPARVSPPGRRLQDELDARGWTQQDLAKVIARPPQMISEIINAKKQITPETALELSEAFGTSAEFWSKLEADYQLFLARKKPRNSLIPKRSQLFESVPVREIMKNGWLKTTTDTDELERELCNFLEINSIDESPAIAVNFRQTHLETHNPETRAQIAWVMRVQKLARKQNVGRFDLYQLEDVVNSLLRLTYEQEGIRRVPQLLKEAGIRFIVVPHLSKTYLDGAAFYLAEREPVIALTLRYDRVDNFWFVLLHELAHIYRGHENVYVDRVEGQDADEAEAEANAYSRDWLVPAEAYQSFVENSFLGFDDNDILRFSTEIRRHPGIVIGRLQRDNLLPYSKGRHYLEKIKWHFTEMIDRA